MTLVDPKYIYRVEIDPNPIYPSISQLNISKILQYLKLNKKMPLELLSSEKEFYLGDPYVILNLLNQIRIVFSSEQSFNKSLSSKLVVTKLRSGESFSPKSIALNSSVNSIKYNELKNKENKGRSLSKKSFDGGSKKVCKVNGVDHSVNPVSILDKQQREQFLMKQKHFFD